MNRLSRFASRRGIYYGWFVVAASFLTAFGGISIVVNAMGTFIKPVSEALGVDRSAFSVCISATSICSTLSLPFWGEYFRRRSQRNSILLIGILIPVLIFCMSCCTKVWQFLLISAALGLLYGPVGSLGSSTLLGKWFERRKGLAVGIASAGSGLGSMLIIPLISAMLESVGYSVAYRVVALAFFVTVFPPALLIIRDYPHQLGLHVDGAKPDKSTGEGSKPDVQLWGPTRAEVLKTGTYYIYLAFTFINGMLYGVVLNHSYAYLTDLGRSAASASAVVSMMMGMLFVGKLVVGYINDRVGTRNCLRLEVGCYLAVYVCMLLVPLGLPPQIIPIFGGFASTTGAVGVALASMKLYGNREYSAIHGIVSGIYMAGNSLGTALAGLVYDSFGAYTPALVVGLGLVAVCFILIETVFNNTAKAPWAQKS